MATPSHPGRMLFVNMPVADLERSKGFFAALVWNSETAELSRQHNDANVVSIGARQHSVEEATELVLLFLRTEFSQDERHVRRIGLITDYERDRHRPAGGLPTGR